MEGKRPTRVSLRRTDYLGSTRVSPASGWGQHREHDTSIAAEDQDNTQDLIGRKLFMSLSRRTIQTVRVSDLAALRCPRAVSPLPLRPQICRHRPREIAARRQLHTALVHRRTFSSRAPPDLHQSAIDPLVAVVAISISAGIGLLASRYLAFDASSPDSAPAEPTYDCDDMTSTAPGRPGNLTEEQEAKLKETWIQLFEIFGVDTPGRARTDTITSENTDAKKKKKGRLSLFGGKSKEPEEDKHGQGKEFEAALSSDEPGQLRAAFWDLVKHDNPDAIVLRYLRARKWDVSAALVMLVSTLHWTLGVQPYARIVAKGEGDALLQSTSDSASPAEKQAGQEFLDICHAGKSFIHGHDIAGRPVVWIRVRLHRSGQQSDATMERFTIYTIENTRLFLNPVVDTATIVFDMQGFSLANMDYAPVKFMIKCFEANYPESLGAVVVYKAPWVFQGVWKVIKGWLDPVVASKIHFENGVEGLEKYIGPRDRIIKEVGGDEDWEYKFVPPTTDENAIMQNTAAREELRTERQALQEKYEQATATWATGAGDAATRSDTAAQLTANYWRLDPYIRARTLYDRLGIIQGGKVDYYPKMESPAVAT